MEPPSGSTGSSHTGHSEHWADPPHPLVAQEPLLELYKPVLSCGIPCPTQQLADACKAFLEAILEKRRGAGHVSSTTGE